MIKRLRVGGVSNSMDQNDTGRVTRCRFRHRYKKKSLNDAPHTTPAKAVSTLKVRGQGRQVLPEYAHISEI